MLLHDSNLKELTPSAIISIPRVINNYRGIFLTGKWFDHIVIKLCDSTLSTTAIQFIFKNNIATTKYSLVYEEIIGHYLTNSNNVYSCLLDEANASDLYDYSKFDWKQSCPLALFLPYLIVIH